MRLTSEGDGLTAAEATAAVITRRAYQQASRLTPADFVGAGFITYLVLNFNVPIGGMPWLFTLSSLVLGTSANTEFRARILTNGVVDQGGPYQPFGIANGVFSVGGPVPSPGPLAAGPNMIELQLERVSGPGIARALSAILAAHTEA